MTRQTPSWLASAIIYEIYPQSFYDTNGDGIGDLPGVIAKLDYIKSLGCDALWLNPCFVSPFRDAGYDVADFYQVAPRYGTNDDLARLCREAHARGMRVLLDLVAGHTSDQNPWFIESCKAQPNRYSNWYVWTNSIWETAPAFINGHADRDGNYLSNFFYHQPALNYGYAKPDPSKPWQLPVTHPDVQAVRAELKNIMRFWLGLGADGFRVDMANSLVKNDADLAETMRLWTDVRGMFDREFPEAVLVSEWSCPEQSIVSGFHVDFLLAWGTPPAYTALLRNEAARDLSPWNKGGHSFFDRAGAGNISDFLDVWQRHYAATRGLGHIAIPSGNHDVTRLAINRDTRDLAVVFAFLLTMPGVPFIYNGDEIGLRQVSGLVSKEGGYNRTGARTPMQWDGGANAGFSTADRERLYLPVDDSADRPTVSEQERDPASLLNTVRRLSAFRKAHKSLSAEGEFTLLFAEANQYPLVYARHADGETFVIAVNPADREMTARFKLPAESLSAAYPPIGGEVKITAADGEWQLDMPPVSAAILRA